LVQNERGRTTKKKKKEKKKKLRQSWDSQKPVRPGRNNQKKQPANKQPSEKYPQIETKNSKRRKGREKKRLSFGNSIIKN
jgi:hypothetical protein